MEDSAIVDLYWQRSEQAIPETEHKYGGYCHTVAMRIVNNHEDAEECVNDTWLGAWNSMPENRPSYLAPYLAKLTRWLSISKLKTQNRLKRGGGEIMLSLAELDSELGEGTDLESGCSESKVKSMLLRIRRRLKKALEEEGLC